MAFVCQEIKGLLTYLLTYNLALYCSIVALILHYRFIWVVNFSHMRLSLLKYFYGTK